jgi:sulfatase maturation enzyme AslB (radical SAM superfamily)
MDENLPFYDLYFKNYMARLEEAHDAGARTLMLTGNCEPPQNRHFLMTFGLMMMLMKNPFRNIEMQTTGVLLDNNYLRFLRNHVGVNTISLSISSFIDSENVEIIGMPKTEAEKFNLKELCANIKKYDFNLRLSLNMTSHFNRYTPSELFRLCKEEYDADQVTFRVLYNSGMNTPQDQWIEKNKADQSIIDYINNYIKSYGKELKILPFGLIKYSVNNMGVVIDNDCMSKTVSENDKYHILRPNCKTYSRWDDEASLEG